MTTIDVRYRSTGVDDPGAYFGINADYAGSTFIPIVATVKLLAGGDQEMIINVGGADVVTAPGLPTDFVALRLLIDPDLNTVNIRVEGVDKGTYAYIPDTPTTDPQCATLGEWGNNGEFDYVRIRVGGNY